MNDPQARNKYKVAVITQFWFKRHSVYRTLARYIAAMAATRSFHIELLYIGTAEHDYVTEHFQNVKIFDDPR